MTLLLRRTDRTATRTIGELLIDGVFFCFTLEDPVRALGVKIPGQTAIPAGTYPVAMTFSQRFQRVLPLVEGVPNFTGIRIHPGNTTADTAGCILVGLARTPNGVLSSRVASDQLNQQIAAAGDRGEAVTLTIENVSVGSAVLNA